MCNHRLHYLLKKHDNDLYAGIMLELPGVLVHASSQKDIVSKLIKSSQHAFNTFDKLHQRALDNELTYSMCRSTLGVPQQINEIIVECPPHGT